MTRVRYETRDAVSYVTLAQPGRGNALDLPMAHDLARCIRRARADDARVVVPAAEGDAFCVGGDIAAFAREEDPEQYSEVYLDDELGTAVDRVVAVLAAGSRSAQVTAKRLLRALANPHAEGAMRRETLAIRTAVTGPDGREGVAAFLGKRPPVFPSTIRSGLL
jgi:enoyl-CoA hydratase/carnithine racemase